MTMRHKPIRPKQYEPVEGKRRGAGEHQVYMTPDQQGALGQWQKDFRTVWPEIQKTGAIAQRIFQEMIDAPQWQIAESEQPEDVSEQKMWTVGHAKVNYVDHIETKGGVE